MVPGGQEATRRNSRSRASSRRCKDRAGGIGGGRVGRLGLLRVDQGKLGSSRPAGNRTPFPLPSPDNPGPEPGLTPEHGERSSGSKPGRPVQPIRAGAMSRRHAVNVEWKCCGTRTRRTGEVWRPRRRLGLPARRLCLVRRGATRPQNGAPGVTLLVVGSDFRSRPSTRGPVTSARVWKPVETLTTPPPRGEISKNPPFGPENLVVIAAPASNPPIDFTALAQSGLAVARGADARGSFGLPLRGNCSNRRSLSLAHAGR